MRLIFDFKGVSPPAKEPAICKFITPKYYLFIAGSIHQSHEPFSDMSPRKQCCFMRLLALLRTQNLPIEQLTASTVDQILAKSHRLYLDALFLKCLGPITLSLLLPLSNRYSYCSC